MTVRELVVKLVLDAMGFRGQVQQAQNDLDKLGVASRQASDAAAKGLTKAAAKADDLSDNAQRAGKSMQQAAKRGEQGFSELWGTLGKVGAALGGLAAVTSTVTNYMQVVTEIEKTSDMLDMSMEAWQGWAYAAKQAGLEAEDVRDRLMDLGDWMTDLNVNDSGPLKDFAEQTKTSFKDARGATLSMEEGLMTLADAVAKMDRQQATSWLQQIGFDEKTTPLILKGRKAIEDFVKAGKEQALYSRRDAENARKMREAWQGVTNIYGAVSGAILRALGPAFDMLADKLTAAARWTRENEDSLVVLLTALAAVIARMLTPALWGMAKAAIAAMGPFAPFIGLALALAAAFDELWAFASGGNSALESLLRYLGMSTESIEGLRSVVRGAIELFGDLWDLIMGTGKGRGEAWDRIKDKIGAVGAAISDFVGSIGKWISDLLPQWIKDLLTDNDAPSSGRGNGAPRREQDTLEALATGGVGPLAGYRAGDAARPAGNVSSTKNVTTSIAQLNIQTQATNADEIARDIGGALQNQTAQADGAVGV